MGWDVAESDIGRATTEFRVTVTKTPSIEIRDITSTRRATAAISSFLIDYLGARIDAAEAKIAEEVADECERRCKR